MRGKWALGIPPRHFTWVLKNKIAICERPGGYGTNHRRVRRQEEIIWIREQRFNCVISLSPLPHNLHNYDELGVAWRHDRFRFSGSWAHGLGRNPGRSLIGGKNADGSTDRQQFWLSGLISF